MKIITIMLIYTDIGIMQFRYLNIIEIDFVGIKNVLLMTPLIPFFVKEHIKNLLHLISMD